MLRFPLLRADLYLLRNLRIYSHRNLGTDDKSLNKFTAAPRNPLHTLVVCKDDTCLMPIKIHIPA